MSLWPIRAGANGEYEPRFFNDNRIFFNWSGLLTDLVKLPDLESFYQVFTEPTRITRRARSKTTPAKLMQPSDWIALPSKFNPTIHFGKIAGPYQYDPTAEDRFQHDLIQNLLAHYDTLDEDLRTELPVKRIWTITNQGEE
jgi:restriction system protein